MKRPGPIVKFNEFKVNENDPWTKEFVSNKPLTIGDMIDKLQTMVDDGILDESDYVFIADGGGDNVQDLRPIKGIDLDTIKFSPADENFFNGVINSKGLKLSLVSSRIDND